MLITHHTLIHTTLERHNKRLGAGAGAGAEASSSQDHHTTDPNSFFFNLPECSNLSGDIQQQSWREMVATCRGYTQ